jgi:hypothetical protein
MSQSQRQSELFAGQDWTAIYRAFTEVNLNAYDFDTIRSSMKDYIQRNYPEDFNDWSESSEFVAIMDLLAYLGQSLAFRMDINARENFMDIARSRESVLRLARFLSYSPKRNSPAKGLVKLTEVRVTQDLVDSQGTNLNNVVVRWDDANNPNWFEQFIMVLNAVFINTNPFGTPLKVQSVNGVNTQLYRLENVPVTAGNIPFSATVDNDNLNFDICNIDFNNRVGFFERSPDPQAAMHIVYRNDGNGNSSPNTGFFLYFKQGELSKADVQISEPQENRLLDLTFPNINDSDVWVQSVTDQGFVQSEWTRVGYVPTDDITKIVIDSDNVTYNSLPIDVQDIYQVITRDNDQISVRFGDGRFGKIPTGNIRIWYRQSTGEYSSIRPDDMRNLTVSMPYQSKDLKQKTFFISFSLQETVINSAPGESNSDIRRRSGAVYATQGRMVSGDDYNALPSTNNIALKVKSINRVYSGHSRFVDLNDPTGTYQNTNVFADDGAIYRERHDDYKEVPLQANDSAAALIASVIYPILADVEIRDFLYDEWLNGITRNPLYNFVYVDSPLWWDRSLNAIYSGTGRFSKSVSLPATDDEWQIDRVSLGSASVPDTPERFIVPGSLVKFRDAGWCTVSNVVGKGNEFKANGEGQVRLNESVERGDQVLKILPAFRRTLNGNELIQLNRRVEGKRTFGMGFDFVKQAWYFIDAGQLLSAGDFVYSSKGTGFDSSWLIKCEYSTLNWRVTSRGIRHVFESERDVKFFFVNDYKSVDSTTGRVGQDKINVLNSNLNPKVARAVQWTLDTRYTAGDVVKLRREGAGNNDPTGDFNYYECMRDHTSGSDFATGLAELDLSVPAVPRAVLVEVWRSVHPGLLFDYTWALSNTYTYDDGHIEPRRVQVGYYDSDADGQPDNPESFRDIVSSEEWVIHQRYRDLNGYDYYRIVPDVKVFIQGEPLVVLNPQEVIFIHPQGSDQGTFYQCLLVDRGVPVIGRSQDILPLVDQSAYRANPGRRNMRFQWKHFAPMDHRIDPAVTNIIDTFVLTREYNDKIQSWLRLGAKADAKPRAPTELQLRLSYSDLEQYKMFSDQIVWRPVRYKFLFGNGAISELRARFKIVKLPGTAASDGEIKSRVIQAIQKFFDVNSWDFGETFYYTELAGYIHTQLVNAISSVVIVPLKDTQSFGELFEVRCLPDEIFFPTASVSDVEIIPSNTQTSLRIK